MVLKVSSSCIPESVKSLKGYIISKSWDWVLLNEWSLEQLWLVLDGQEVLLWALRVNKSRGFSALSWSTRWLFIDKHLTVSKVDRIRWTERNQVFYLCASTFLRDFDNLAVLRWTQKLIVTELTVARSVDENVCRMIRGCSCIRGLVQYVWLSVLRILLTSSLPILG
jgi:hypothetical protein